jgi:hypothetical protein
MRLLGRSQDRTIITLVTTLEALPDDRFSTLSFVPLLRWCHRHFRNDAHTNVAYDLLRRVQG